MAKEINRRAKGRGIRVVFWLHNFAYNDRSPFEDVDLLIVPSRFAQSHYRDKLGLESTVIPGPWNWDRVKCDSVEGKYVTFVNPSPEKGVFLFARIVHDMWQIRPDIPFLVVEGRAKANWLTRTGLDLRGMKNVFVMENTPDPRDFYRVSKMVLMPSLWYESFPRVAVEAMINGIPVLGTRRGGLAEVLENAGFLFDVPDRYTGASREVPASEDARPWIDAVVRLWDDSSVFDEQRGQCAIATDCWRPEKLLDSFGQFI